MLRDYTNRYGRYRRAAGITQERAAELLGCSVESVKAYETGVRFPPDEIVVTMCDVYGAPTLAVEHLRTASALGAEVLPPVEPRTVAEAVCRLCAALRRVEAEDLQTDFLSIAADGRVDELEAEQAAELMAELQEVVAAAMELRFSMEGAAWRSIE